MWLERARGRVDPEADRRVLLKAQRLRVIIVETLSQPGTGRAYKRGTKGDITHIASAPGAPPAVDTGRLRQSIGTRKISQARYAVGTNVAYAPLLERGTRRMRPRPFMRPSANKLIAEGGVR